MEPGTIGIDVERYVRDPSLRVGVLACIAHRAPPRGYGRGSQVASTLPWVVGLGSNRQDLWMEIFRRLRVGWFLRVVR
jgi:hypothetical protein